MHCRWTALHEASSNGHAETAKALVAAGMDVHCNDKKYGYGLESCMVGLLASVSFADGAGGSGLALSD